MIGGYDSDLGQYSHDQVPVFKVRVYPNELFNLFEKLFKTNPEDTNSSVEAPEHGYSFPHTKLDLQRSV